MLCYKDADGNVHKIASFTAPAKAHYICVYNGTNVEKYPLAHFTDPSPDNAHQQPTVKNSKNYLGTSVFKIARNINGTAKHQFSIASVFLNQRTTGIGGKAYAWILPSFNSSRNPLMNSYTDNVINESRNYEDVSGVGISYSSQVSFNATLTRASQYVDWYSIKSGQDYTRTFAGSTSVCTDGVYFSCHSLIFNISQNLSAYPVVLNFSWDKESGATSMSSTLSTAQGNASGMYSISLSHRDTASASRSSISYKVSARIRATSIINTQVTIHLGYVANEPMVQMTYLPGASVVPTYLTGYNHFTHCQSMTYKVAQSVKRFTSGVAAGEVLEISNNAYITNTANEAAGVTCSKSSQYTYHWDNIYTDNVTWTD